MRTAPAALRFLPTLTLLAAACGDSSAPPQPVALDAAAFEAALDALDDVLATEPWVSFGQLGAAFVLPVPPPAPTTLARVPVVPDQFLGSTFVHDGAGYVADPSRTDAPADGVRFVLYALQPGTQAPSLDAEIAMADVRDVGAGLSNGFALDIAVVAPLGDVARYAATFEAEAAPPATSGARRDHDGVVLVGTLEGDGDVLTFDLTSGAVNGFTVTDLALALATGDLAIAGVLGEDGTTSMLDFDLSMTSAGETLRLTGGRAGGSLQATISQDGTAIATVTGAGSPAVAAAGEHELSVAQIAVLARVAGIVDVLLELVHHVVDPVEL
jgi:hypothetical protein